MSIGVSVSALSRLASSSDATETSFRVMFLLIGHVDRRKIVEMTQQQMADSIGCSRESVCRAIQKLKKMGLIQTGMGAIQFVDGVIAFEDELEIEGCHGWQ